VEARDAVAALARHVVLKVPDKADFRGLAAAAAAELVAELPTAHQHAFVVFTARLSRGTKARCCPQPSRAVLQLYESASRPSTCSRVVGRQAFCQVRVAALWVMSCASSSVSQISTPKIIRVLQWGPLLVQVAHRLMAVEVARLLLAELPDPFSASSVILPGSLPAPSTTARVSSSSNRRIAGWLELAARRCYGTPQHPLTLNESCTLKMYWSTGA